MESKLCAHCRFCRKPDDAVDYRHWTLCVKNARKTRPEWEACPKFEERECGTTASSRE